MKIIKRLFAVLTAFLMMITILPFPAAAAEEIALDNPAGEEEILTEEEISEQELPQEAPLPSGEPDTAKETVPENGPDSAEPASEDQEPEEEAQTSVHGLGGYTDEMPSNNWISEERVRRGEKNEALPKKYDSRDLSIVTGIRDQGSYGTCWAHSALACVETYMIKHKIKDGSTGEAATTDLNLSETQLAWYTYTDAYDPLDMLEGDVTNVKTDPNDPETYLDIGGSAAYAGLTLLRGTGPAPETVEKLKYSNADEKGYGSAYAYAYNNAMVTDMIWLPGSNRDGVKELLLEYGAGVVAYRHNDNYFNTDSTAYCFTQAGFSTHYGTNHLVAVVGWDDDYSKDNFNTASSPENNGAWLVKGSWGTDVGDNGYYYISYEDYWMINTSVFFFTAAEQETYDYIYQYDGTAAWTYLKNSTGYMQLANQFTANTYENLEAASVCVAGEGLSYVLSIYKNSREDDPLSGNLVRSVSGTFQYSGYHLVEFSPVSLSPKENYYVVFTIQGEVANDSGYYFYPYIDRDYSANLYTAEHELRERSLIRSSSTGSWTRPGSGADLRIKAYTSDVHASVNTVSGSMKLNAESEILVDQKPNSGISDWRIISGSLPPGVHLYEGLQYISVYGKPEKAGEYEAKTLMTRPDGSPAYYTVKITVISDDPALSSELLVLPTTVTFERRLLVGGNGVSAVNAYMSSGSIPPGTELDEDGIVSLGGTPHKNGRYDFTVFASDSSGNTYEHKVRTAVCTEGSKVARMPIDFSHGNLYIFDDMYESYVLTTLRMLAQDGKITFKRSGDTSFVDVDKDGSNDIRINKGNHIYTLKLMDSHSLRRSYKYTLSQDAIDYFSSETYFKETTFQIPFAPVEVYSMDLEFSKKVISVDEYYDHIMWPLSVMERDGQITVRSYEGTAYVDLDNNGGEDICITAAEDGVTFEAATTNNRKILEVTTTPAQQAEIADYSWSAKTLRFRLPEPAESFGLNIGNVEVTTRNMADVLNNGVFEFDGDKTLLVKGDFETDRYGIYNHGLDGLIINVMKDSRLTCSQKPSIMVSENTTITGSGHLQLSSPTDCGIYALNNSSLSIVSAHITADGRWGISGPTGESGTKLIISRSVISASGTDGAVCDFAGGITLKDCYISKPLYGKISDNGRQIADQNGDPAAEVEIVLENPLPNSIFTADSVPAVGCHMTVDIETMAERDDTLMMAYLADEVTYRWYRNGVFVDGAASQTFKISSDSRYSTIYAVVFFDEYRIESEHFKVMDNPFTDVKENRYFYEPVLWAYYRTPQVTTGTTPTTFSPDDKCTRAQVVTFLWRSAGTPEPVSTANPFKDVRSDKYYYKAVLWALENNITTGTSPTQFSPDSACTRAQVVTFLWRTKGSPEPMTSANPFEDVKSDKYYYKAVLWALENNITTGTDAARFSPDGACTRGQIVTFLYRCMTQK